MNDFIIYAVPIILISLLILIVIFTIVTYRIKKLFSGEPPYLLEFGSRSEAVKHLILLQNVRIKGCDEQTRAHIKRQEEKIKQMLEEK